MRTFVAAAAIASFSLTGTATAEFWVGQPIAVNGAAGPEFGGTQWGTWAGQGAHPIGGATIYFDAFFPQFTVTVTSILVAPLHLSVVLDYSSFAPGDFTNHVVDLVGLKNDNSIQNVLSSQGVAGTNGNDVFWAGLGASLQQNPIVKIDIFQIPAPGAIALLGVAGIAVRRRRA